MAIVTKQRPERVVPQPFQTVRYDYNKRFNVPDRSIALAWLEMKGWKVSHRNDHWFRVEKGDLKDVPLGCAILHEFELEMEMIKHAKRNPKK